MASSSPRDEVNKPESTVAQPVDISASDNTPLVPRGTSATASQPTTVLASTEASQLATDSGTLSQKPTNNTDTLDQEDAAPPLNSAQDVKSLIETLASDDNSKLDANQVSADSLDGETLEVDSVRSAGFEGSLGSDTETGKLESTSAGKDAVPKYSVKKLSGFKPVSVTKSFLAKAGTAVLPLKTVSDKGVSSPSSPAPGSATSTNRPRLVAKTLSSSRTAAPKSLNSGLQKSGADGPDPNQVWNRNRVQMAPQATPKHMTDEELRQQYGIQLASRPLEGADNSQTKWADLEDEDEDWAPDMLEWSDGTKINLALAETPSSGLPLDKSKGSLEVGTNATEKAASAAKTTSLGPKATVLKLGTAINQPKQPIIASGNQSLTKASNEKPTLVAKPSAALPTKSPWAPLPPVDKVSPVAPPVQQSLTRNAQRESYGRDPNINNSQPTREIAADDYSRFSANANPRELFNSQSGRYEPVSDARRLSGRKDPGFRAPSLLQRPSQNEMQSLNEQSPTYQSRPAQDPAAWRRRRASSNVSNDSGAFGRRMSMSRPGPEGFGRRDSGYDQSIGSGPSIHPENRVSSPAISHGPSHVSQQSPINAAAGMVASLERYPANQTAETPVTPNFGNIELEVAQQKKLMRERAEAAMKRRKEEEAREEAEKRERLKLKLEALEPKKDLQTAEAPILPDTLPNGTQTTTATQDTSKPLTPPKPPAPSLNGEPQQYGLIKMHASNHASTNVGADGKLLQTASSPDNVTRVEQHRGQDMGQPLQGHGVAENKVLPKQSAVASVNHQFEKDKSSQQNHRVSGQTGPAGFQSSVWSQTGMTNQPPNVNVWALPGSQKALGNGDFQKNITQIHLPPVSSQQYPQHLASPQTQPQPIGTPRQAPHGQATTPQAPKDQSPHVQQYPSELAPQSSHPRVHAQLPNAPKDTQSQHPLINNMGSRPVGVAAWGDFSRNVSVYDAQKKAQLAQEHAALVAERERAGLPTHQAPVLRETWTQVAKGDNGGTRRTVTSSATQRDLGTGEDVLSGGAQHPPTRSRYQDLFDQGERAFIDVIRPQEPLTPPPEENDHPAFTGGAQRPKVRLPPLAHLEEDHDENERPSIPKVRLPVLSAYNSHPTASASHQLSRQTPAPLRHQPPASNIAWQEKIYGLFDKASPRRLLEIPLEIPSEVSGFSTSKEPLEQIRVPHTPVSLPLLDAKTGASIPNKSVEEEIALLEEGRDFGSVPAVRIPLNAPTAVSNPSRPSRDMRRMKLAMLTEADVHGVLPFLPFDLYRNSENTISIKLLPMETAKLVPYVSTASRQHRTPFPAGRGGKTRNTSGQHHNGQKPKDTPAQANTTAGQPNEKPRTHGTGSRKPSGHSYSNNWAHSTKRAAPAPAAVH